MAEELTAINQYMVHAEMCDNWRYEKLHKEIEKRAIDEMKHADKLIARILFLEGRPVVSNLNTMHIGDEVLRCIRMIIWPRSTPFVAITKASAGRGAWRQRQPGIV